MARVDQSLLMENEAPRARVARVLKDWIGQGILKKGAPLPSERALSKKLGASPATVQRALRILESEGMVSELTGRTRVVVESVARAPMVASSLVIIAPVSEPIRGHTQPGWSEFITLGAIAAARQAGQRVLTLDPKSILEEWKSGRLTTSAYGVIVTAERELRKELQQVIEAYAAAGTPVVVYGDSQENATYDRVSSDHVTGCRELTTWLIQQGCKRILPVWPEGGKDAEARQYWIRQRREGYEQAMRQAGLEPMPTLWLPCPEQQASAESTFQTYLHTVAGYLVPYLAGTRKMDAMLAVSDGEMRVLGAACRLFGCSPDRDLMIGGYDHYSSDSTEKQFEPAEPKATVDKQNWRIGQEMITLLIQRIDQQLPPQPQCRLIKPELVVLC